jgi:D-aminoacyl-tRNA deacylase
VRVLVTSTQDIASLTIKQVLKDEHDFAENGDSFEGNPILARGDSSILITTTRDMIECEHLDDHFNAEVFIFCSRHRAASGKPALLVHSTGNLIPEADFGGSPQQLSVSSGTLVAHALKTLHHEKEIRGLVDFDVTMEVTHHGPTSMNTPLLFIELGSEEEFWRNKDGARAVASAAMACMGEEFAKRVSIGFGGNHYASKFNRLVLEKGICLGHMAPKHAIEKLTIDVVRQMMNRSQEDVEQAIIDWKGANSEQKAHLFPILEELGVKVVRAKHL